METPDDLERTRTRHDVARGSSVGPGATVAGYQVIRELGRGGMGVVYEVSEPSSGRRIALKVLDAVRGGYDLELALREARMMAKVSHPNTVFLYRAELMESGLLLAMEMVRGETLAELMRREGPLPVPRAITLALQILEGLRAYDQHGIVHRDVKPSNCFLDHDGCARIGDLGLSRTAEMISQLTQEGRFVGTPHYSSPEQLRGSAVDRRSDIYSLGATIFEMISGRRPIEAPDSVTLIARIMTEPPAPLSRFVAVPAGLERAIAKTLAKYPEGRFAGYDELAAALAPYGLPAVPVAPLGIRFTAALGDFAIFGLLQEGLATGVLTVDFTIVPGWLAAALSAVYFGITEVHQRASLMKWVFGLRVVSTDGSRARFPQAVARTSLKTAAVGMMLWPSVVVFLTGTAVALLIFLPAALEGRAGLHDRLTGTRVTVGRARLRMRRRSSAATRAASVESAPSDGLRFGPYAPRRPLVTDDAGTLWLAEDPFLSRPIWVRQWSETAAGCSTARRALERATRPRWIAAGETAGRRWDAFEAPRDATSLFAHPRRRAWRDVRGLLRQLSDELLAGMRDGTLPDGLSLGQVAVGRDDRVTLLDRPFEPEAAAAPRYATEPEGLRRFVQAVSFALATGTNPPTELSADDGWLARIPVADHDVLAALWSASRDPLEVISELQTAFSREMSGLDELNAPARMRQHFYSLVLGAFAWPFAWGALQGVIEALQDEELPARPSPLAAMVLGVLLPVSSAVLARGGIGIGLSGAELRTVDGAPADYGRALARSLPLAACTGAASYASAAGHRWEAVALVAAIGALAVVQAAVSPARGPGDYLARTFIRPR